MNDQKSSAAKRKPDVFAIVLWVLSFAALGAMFVFDGFSRVESPVLITIFSIFVMISFTIAMRMNRFRWWEAAGYGAFAVITFSGLMIFQGV